LDRVAPGTGETQSRVADDWIADDDAELAATRLVVRLARSAGCITYGLARKQRNVGSWCVGFLTNEDLIVGAASWDMFRVHGNGLSHIDPSVRKLRAARLGNDESQRDEGKSKDLSGQHGDRSQGKCEANLGNF
jgi:hypothetical protein